MKFLNIISAVFTINKSLTHCYNIDIHNFVYRSKNVCLKNCSLLLHKTNLIALILSLFFFFFSFVLRNRKIVQCFQ